MKETNLIDHGFMDARIKLIDVAAFLDRVERHGQTDDYRYHALKAVSYTHLTLPTNREV